MNCAFACPHHPRVPPLSHKWNEVIWWARNAKDLRSSVSPMENKVSGGHAKTEIPPVSNEVASSCARQWMLVGTQKDLCSSLPCIEDKISWHVASASRRVVGHAKITYCTTSYYIILCHLTWYDIILYYTIPNYTILYYYISYHIISDKENSTLDTAPCVKYMDTDI